MEHIIKLIEAKLAQDESTIYWQERDIEELKRKLAKAEETIAVQVQIINDLKGAKNETL